MIVQIWRGRTPAEDRRDAGKEAHPPVSGDLTPVPDEVVADPRRSRLYARLRRRFPLRIAAPR